MTSLFRYFLKNKFFSAITVLGLTVAVTVFLLIAQYVKWETSYESTVPDAKDIFRVSLSIYSDNVLVTTTAENYPGVGPALTALPEVESYARLYNLGYKNNVVITNEQAVPPIAVKQPKFL